VSSIDHYRHRIAPFPHQDECLRASYRKRSYAIFMDPGLGKTKVVLDTTALLYRAGFIKGLLVAAPNDVHAQWVDEQIPTHLPTDINVRAVTWDAGRARTRREAVALLTPLPDRLHVLAMNHEAFATKAGRDIARRFLKQYPSMFVLDESHAFKTPRTHRTRAVLDMSDLAFARRIMSGTPTDGVPFELYSQFAFLDERILGFDSFLAFKHRYGVWSKEHVRVKGKEGEKPRLREYEALQAYQNLDELYARIAPFTFTVTKADCKSLPPKLYARIPTHLSDAQRAVYTQLLDAGLVLLDNTNDDDVEDRDAHLTDALRVLSVDELDDEELLSRLQSADMRMSMRIKLTLMLRLQQAAAGFVTDDNRRTMLIDGTWDRCPRIVATVEYVKEALAAQAQKVIVWAHYRAALDVLTRALSETLGDCVVKVDGTVKGEARREAIASFKDRASPVRVLVAHPRTMGTGQNLGMASYCVYYTNSYSLIQRTQSEDRIDRIDRTLTCTIADVVARDAPCDLEVLAAHAAKKEFTDTLAHMTSKQIKERLRTC
jgi:SNF2 family DNA or RNA helicase